MELIERIVRSASRRVQPQPIPSRKPGSKSQIQTNPKPKAQCPERPRQRCHRSALWTRVSNFEIALDSRNFSPMHVAILHPAVSPDASPEDQDTLVQADAGRGGPAAVGPPRRADRLHAGPGRASAGPCVGARPGGRLQPGRVARRGTTRSSTSPLPCWTPWASLHRQPDRGHLPDHAQAAGQAASEPGRPAHAGLDDGGRRSEHGSESPDASRRLDHQNRLPPALHPQGRLGARLAGLDEPTSIRQGDADLVRAAAGGVRRPARPALLRRAVHRGPGVQPGDPGRAGRRRRSCRRPKSTSPPSRPASRGSSAIGPSGSPDSFEFAEHPADLRLPGRRTGRCWTAFATWPMDCWRLFGLRGYARVDFRVDAQLRPWILEINTNPCLSPDAGFAAALASAASPSAGHPANLGSSHGRNTDQTRIGDHGGAPNAKA